jgi:hypothetical protein
MLCFCLYEHRSFFTSGLDVTGHTQNKGMTKELTSPEV